MQTTSAHRARKADHSRPAPTTEILTTEFAALESLTAAAQLMVAAMGLSTRPLTNFSAGNALNSAPQQHGAKPAPKTSGFPGASSALFARTTSASVHCSW
jgi:hypothetical protein